MTPHRLDPALPDPHDPLFLALAQPLLRGPSGEPLVVTPGPGGAGIRAAPLPPAAAAQAPRCYGHSRPQDPLAWMATHDRLLALLDGHKPLNAQPEPAWGGAWPPPLRPWPQCLAVRAAGLDFVFVNAPPLRPGEAPCVRIFALDGQQAVECEPVADAIVLDAWAQGGAVWACGLQPRRDEPGGATHFGRALRLCFSLKPFALAQRFVDADRCHVAPALANDPTLPERVNGLEAWWASLPMPGDANERLLLGAPLGRAHHGDLSPLWWMAEFGAGEHADVALALWRDGEAAPQLQSLWKDRAFLARCAGPGDEALLFLLHTGLEQLGQATARQLRLLRWPPVASGAPGLSEEPLAIEGLPPAAHGASLVDLDAVHHPAFGYAAALSWLLPAGRGEVPGRCAGALLHSRDGVRWKQVQELR